MNKFTSAERKKIVAISTSYPLRDSSVSGIFVHRLYAALAVSWDIQVLCPDDAKMGSSALLDGVSIVPVKYAPKKWQLLGGAGGLVPSIKSSPFKAVLLPALLLSLFSSALINSKSAVLIHANWAVCGAIAVMIGKIRRIPVVTTLRGDDIARAQKSWVDKVLLNITVLGSNKIICVSSAMADQLHVHYPKRKKDITFCLNGVDDSFFKIKRTENKTGVMRIVSVGSLIPRKGYDLLIQAVALINQKYPIHVIIAGDGPSKQELMKQAESSGVTETFEFVGEIGLNAVQELLANADVFVLSSLSEGRPNVVVEAMASALPIISANLDGVRDLVIDGHNGWKFKTGSADDLARAIERAVQSLNNLHVLGYASSVLLGGSHSWAYTAQRYTEYFSAVLNKSEIGQGEA